jgi:ABC-type nickel/cobalt efflux system permease component RcnA
MLAAIIAAGIRPCSGSILVLVFALSQNLFFYGVLAAIAIGVGTAITTSALAMFAIWAKSAALKIARSHAEARAAILIQGLEVLAAALVFTIGTSLLYASATGLVPNG